RDFHVTGVQTCALPISNLLIAYLVTAHPATASWAAAYRIEPLGSLGGSHGRARAINGNGQVVGEATVPAGAEHAFIWQGGVISEIGRASGRERVGREVA